MILLVVACRDVFFSMTQIGLYPGLACVAKKGQQQTYLRLQDGSNSSRVSPESIKLVASIANNTKTYIYIYVKAHVGF